MGKWSSRSLIKEVKKNLKQLFTFSQADKTAFVQALTTKFPNVCLCPTESDVCIAETYGTDNNSYVVSGDSDLLIYANVTNVLRPIPNRYLQFAKYTKASVLEVLELPSASHLLLYGIVSRNDYSMNVTNLGLARNAKIIAGIKEAIIPAMLKAYVDAVNQLQGSVDISQFRDALSVFYNLHQTPALQQINRNNFDVMHNAMKAAINARHANKNQNTDSR